MLVIVLEFLFSVFVHVLVLFFLQVLSVENLKKLLWLVILEALLLL